MAKKKKSVKPPASDSDSSEDEHAARFKEVAAAAGTSLAEGAKDAKKAKHSADNRERKVSEEAKATAQLDRTQLKIAEALDARIGRELEIEEGGAADAPADRGGAPEQPGAVRLFKGAAPLAAVPPPPAAPALMSRHKKLKRKQAASGEERSSSDEDVALDRCLLVAVVGSAVEEGARLATQRAAQHVVSADPPTDE